MQLVRESLYDDFYYFNVLNESLLNEEFNIQKIRDIASKIKDKKDALNKFIKRFNETKNINIKKYVSIIIVVLFLASSVIHIESSNDIKNISNKVSKEQTVNVEKIKEIVKETSKDNVIANAIDYRIAKTSKETKNFIKEHETLSLTAYKDNNMVSIGWGHAEYPTHTKYVVGESKITKQQAEILFEKDILKVEKGIKRIFARWENESINIKIDQEMFDSMVSMAFNMGLTGLAKTEFIKHLKNNDHKMAAEKIKTARVSSKFSGLSARRQKEYELFSKNIF
jgi:lysozyme